MKLIQLEVWSDFEANAGSRIRIVPLSSVLAAAIAGDLKGQLELSLGVDKAIASLLGGSIIPFVNSTFTLTSSGLAFRDRFNRADSDTVGMSWLEKETAAGDNRIITNNLGQTGVSSWIWQASVAGHPVDFIIQHTATGRTGDSDQLVARGGGFIGTTFGTDLYRTIRRTNNNDQRLFRSVGGVSTQLGPGAGITQLPNEFWQTRLVGKVEGSDFRLRTYQTEVAGLGVLTVTPILRLNFLDLAANLPPVGTQIAIVEGAASESKKDENFLCGVDFTMTGMPTGSSIDLDGGASSPESGGTAVIEAAGQRLPGDLVTVKNASSQTIGEYSVPGGIWGGDLVSLDTVGSPAAFVPGAERRVIRAVLEDKANPRNAGQVQEFRIG